MTTLIGVGSLLIAGLLIGGFLGFIVAVIIGVVLVALWARLVRVQAHLSLAPRAPLLEA
jgi:hypothetical protein